MLRRKFKQPVVFWKDGVIKDMRRVRKFIEIRKIKYGCSVFIDEGRHFRNKDRYKKPPFGAWKDMKNISGVSLLIYWVKKGKKNG